MRPPGPQHRAGGGRGRPAALMTTPQVRSYHDHVLVKEAGTAQRTPWHQDQPYYNVDGHGISAWISVGRSLPLPRDG
jgi:hypothetical protein